MLDWFEVNRNAEQYAQAWGPIDYLYPHLKGSRFKKGSKVGVVVHDGKDGLRYGQMVLDFKADLKVKSGLVHVDEDALLTGKTLNRFMKKNRCLVPVDSWQLNHKGRDGSGVFTFHPSTPSPMFFAGLYSSFPADNGTKVNTVGIVGIASRDYYVKFGNRMPAVFLPGPEAINYANPKTPETKAWELLRSFPEEQMTVSKGESIPELPKYD